MKLRHKKGDLSGNSNLREKLFIANIFSFNPTPVQRPRQLQWLKWDWNNFRI